MPTRLPKPARQIDVAKKVLSVVIPVYNELRTWRALLDAVLAVPLADVGKEIILVDDASTDGTGEELRQLERDGLPAKHADVSLCVLFHARNRGKGAALQTGFAKASGDVIIVQDADLEYDPADYPTLIEPILRGKADVVYGTRMGRGRPKGMTWRTYLANRFLTALSNLTTGLNLSDMETCYKVLSRDSMESVKIEQERFGFEPEITARLAKRGRKIVQVPIRYSARTRAEGKKIGFKDGLEAIGCILKYWLTRSR